MSKNILVLYYSQTGQLKEIVDNFISPIINAGFNVEFAPIQPEEEFEFPWSSNSFFNVMPESVLGIPVQLKPFNFKQNSYDLVVFAYQPWFLSPSLPAISALKDETIINLLKGSKVITLIGARNMWLSSQEIVRRNLKEIGANLVGNIVLTDKHNNYISAVTILHWLLDGKKTKRWGILPMPGISQMDIDGVTVFGNIVLDNIQKNNFDSLQNDLLKNGAVKVFYDYIFIESKATRLFSIWANLIIKKKNRTFWLKLYKYYLIVALFIAAPIIVTLNSILIRPFINGRILKMKKYYEELNYKI